MRAKKLFISVALAGLFTFAYAGEAAVDTTAMGVHPYKETSNMVWPTTGFSLMFQGGINVFRGDYPGERFSNLGYPTAGLALEYNFTPTWGIGVGYLFAMPQVKTTKDEAFRDVDGTTALTVAKGDYVHKGMMHRGQVYATFNLVNAWFPRSVADVFGLSALAGAGVALYKNDISFNDLKADEGDAGKYIKDDASAHAHGKYESVGFVALGGSADFNVSRSIALGVRAQYSLFLNDYVDNRFMDKANKRNDAMVDIDLHLRWKIAAKKKNHLANVSSLDVLENKFYESHPEAMPSGGHRVDTVVVLHKDTIVIVHRDTIVMSSASVAPVVTPIALIEERTDVVAQQEGELREFDLEEDYEIMADAVVAYGQSLSQLARKYYNNTFCWAFIWLANRNLVPDPNLILPKDPLKIPALTPEQKSITKEEAKAIAAKYRGQQQ